MKIFSALTTNVDRTDVMCLNNSDDEICNNRVKEWKVFSETIWFVYSTRIFTVLSHNFSKLFFMCEAHFSVVISTLSRCVCCVYFPFLHENVYGVHVNRFVYSDDVKFYSFLLLSCSTSLGAFLGSATVFSIWKN